MVKVKLRVPLSSAPRETSSPTPTQIPCEVQPDYSDDDEAATPLRDGGTPDDNAEVDGSTQKSSTRIRMTTKIKKTNSTSWTSLKAKTTSRHPKLPQLGSDQRRSITLKSPSLKRRRGFVLCSPSAEGSASPHSGSHKLVKRSSLLEWRKCNPCRWRSSMRFQQRRGENGQSTRCRWSGQRLAEGAHQRSETSLRASAAERTPATYGNTAPVTRPRLVNSDQGKTPTPCPDHSAAAAETHLELRSSTDTNKAASPLGTVRSSIVPTAASSSIKIVSGPGGQTFTGDLSAKAGTAKNPGFPISAVAELARRTARAAIVEDPTAFQTVVPLERNARQPRRWVKAKREIFEYGGRPWSIPFCLWW